MKENGFSISPKRVIVAIIWTIGLFAFEFKAINFLSGYCDARWKVAIAITVGTLAYIYTSMFAIAGVYLFIKGLVAHKKGYIYGGLALVSIAIVISTLLYLLFDVSSVAVMILAVAGFIAVFTTIRIICYFRKEE